MQLIYSPNITTSPKYNKTTETQRSWWTKVTQFPVKATVEIKGLLRPSILMTYVKINAVMFGQKHISSGLYVITGQTDRVDSTGYKTTLNLTRIAGDRDYIIRTTREITGNVPVGLELVRGKPAPVKVTSVQEYTNNTMDTTESVMNSSDPNALI